MRNVRNVSEIKYAIQSGIADGRECFLLNYDDNRICAKLEKENITMVLKACSFTWFHYTVVENDR